LRFDDMLETVLMRPRDSESARIAAWRQLVDILAQRRGEEDNAAVDAAYAMLDELRPEIPREVRSEAANAIAGRRIPRRMMAYFAGEPAALSAPILSAARMDADDWLALLPTMPSASRSVLRHRRDLDDSVVQALASFGATDFVISGEIGESAATWEEAPILAELPAVDADEIIRRDPALQRGEAQIRELVARIEAFRKRAVPAAAPAIPMPSESVASNSADWPRLESFRWETGADGVVLWVEGAPREALIGQSIALASSGGDAGVDAQASGAFSRRAPFRDARLWIAGAGTVAGDWRISAVPFFDPVDGRFLGYRGTARRPRIDETAAPGVTAMLSSQGLYGTGLPPDSLRQLVHELRTPLNAILGFAEMIDRELLGPAAEAYRTRAAEITGQAARLIAAVDDLDTAARIETSRLTLDNHPLEPAALLARLEADYAALAESRGATLMMAIAPSLPLLEGDMAAVERMFTRLLASTIGLAQAGETIVARLDLEPTDSTKLRFILAQPLALAGREETALLDPDFAIEGDWPDAPALGLGFSLRLVRHLARASGGTLEVGGGAFILSLPLSRAGAAASDRA
jgi:hypothetical protein